MHLTFEEFVAAVEPGLRRALLGHLPVDAVPDALGEAFAYAWEHLGSGADAGQPGGLPVQGGADSIPLEARRCPSRTGPVPIWGT